MDTGERVVLVVDPDGTDRDAACSTLRDDTSPGPALRVTQAASFDAATDALGSLRPDCIVTEYDLDGHSGLDLVALARERTPDAACILYTDTSPGAIRTEDFGDVVVEYLSKDLPGAPLALARLVGNSLGQRAQVAYPLPDSEDERLAAIERYDVDDLDAREAVDRLTDLVGTHFDVAVAFVGIVDAHEERFLACHGADWARMDREDTICTHTLLAEEHHVVEDVQSDSRFAGIDLLGDLDIRSYAGVPLRTPEDLPIGALCLIHDEPRCYSAAALADLDRFAAELMEQLELRRRLRETAGPPAEADR